MPTETPVATPAEMSAVQPSIAPAVPPAAAPRPYGPIGLIVSLFVIVLLFALFLVILVGLGAAAYAATHGLAALVALWRDFSGSVVSGDLQGWTLPVFALSLPVYAALLAAILALAVWRGGRQWRVLIGWAPWSPRRAGLVFWLLVLCGILYGLAAGAAAYRLNPQVKQYLPPGAGGYGLAFAVAVIAAPVVEDVLFRGWIYTSLRRRWSFGVANVIASALFAAAHAERTHLYALAIFPLGLLLGAVREKTGSTKASATFHAFYNGVILTLAYVAGVA
jgi:membrane protease YdiL (CAAX protease family)